MKMQKQRFRIGELATLLQIKRFVIRFWEKEFNLKSYRSPGGQRFYTRKDVDTFQLIKKLLYQEGFTIAGAKKALNKDSDTYVIGSQKTTVSTQKASSLPKVVRQELGLIHGQLIKLKQKLQQIF